MRWSQGWSQVSLRHLTHLVRAFDARRRWGAAHLLGWREVYPWISTQILPLLLFWLIQDPSQLRRVYLAFALTTVFTLSVGPAQVAFAWRLADPEIRAHPRWFWDYLVISSIGYTEVKNVIARTAHLKEAMREHVWKVTPRTGAAAQVPEDAAPDPLPTGR